MRQLFTLHSPNRQATLLDQGQLSDQWVRVLSRCARRAVFMIALMIVISTSVWISESARGQSAQDFDVQKSLQQVRSLWQESEYEKAAELLTEIDATLTATESGAVHLAADYVLLARAAGSALPEDTVASLFASALDWLSRADVPQLSLERRILLRTSIASHLVSRGEIESGSIVLLDSFAELEESVSNSEQPTRKVSVTEPLVALTMQAAWPAMTQGKASIAERLYQAILKASSDRLISIHDSRLALARLGYGWATALQSDRESIAADRLNVFLDHHSDHPDAPQASALRVRCLGETKELPRYLVAINDHFAKHAGAAQTPPLAFDLVIRHFNDADFELPDTVLRWLGRAETLDDWPMSLVSHSIILVAHELNPAQFDRMIDRLTSTDKTGSWTAQTLEGCQQRGHPATSEAIAGAVIGKRIENATEMSFESVCRWAGRTGRWSMLALAAEEIELNEDFAGRTLHADRLFAESLLQNGQANKSLDFWKYVVDVRGADDFATLLRCAECAISCDDVQQADRRLQRLRRLIDEEGRNLGNKRTLIDLLEADLAIRKLKFDHARTLLESVVRSPDSSVKLRGRAQWMIGETYLLQQQYARAIDAYRLVEGLDPGGDFVAAALVQAGKAFEQLGRTREAGVCYGTLLERFADSSHAAEARRRMAILPTQTQSSTRR